MSKRVRLIVSGVGIVLIGLGMLAYRYYEAKPSGYAVAPAFVRSAKSRASEGVAPVDAMVTVHVAGCVVNPGVYTVPDTDRVMDVIKKAGGVLPNADLDKVKLASKVKDGQYIHVKAVETRVESKREKALKVTESSFIKNRQFPIDLNTCSADELRAIPGLSQKVIKKIIAYRETYGRFYRLEDLSVINGMTPKKVEAIRPYLTL